MGGCCGGRNTKYEAKSEVTMKSQIIKNSSVSSFSDTETINHSLNGLALQEKEINELRILNQKIDAIISAYPSFEIKKITIESIWNISKFYLFDFTLSEYILFDLREKEQKTENFLKHYKCINYTIDNIQNFTPDKALIFKKFVFNKKIVIIPSDDKMEQLSQLIHYLEENSINKFHIYILSQILKEDLMIKNNFYLLYSHIDDNEFVNYPHILLPLRKINYIRNDSYIFIDNIKESLFTKENISNANNIDAFPFISNFHIKIILHISTSNDICSIENYQCGVYYIAINQNMTSNKALLNRVINLMKSYILNQSGIVILYDLKDFQYQKLYSILSLFLVRIFYRDYSYNNLCEMLYQIISSANLLHFPTDFINEISKEISNEVGKLNIETFPLLGEATQKRMGNTIQSLYINSKDKKNFLTIINVIERIMLNVLNHPKNQKFYKVKKDSNTFKNNIENNVYAKNLFENFMFEKKSNQEFYSLNEDTNLIQFQELYDYLVFYVKCNLN